MEPRSIKQYYLRNRESASAVSLVLLEESTSLLITEEAREQHDDMKYGKIVCPWIVHKLLVGELKSIYVLWNSRAIIFSWQAHENVEKV